MMRMMKGGEMKMKATHRLQSFLMMPLKTRSMRSLIAASHKVVGDVFLHHMLDTHYTDIFFIGPRFCGM